MVYLKQDSRIPSISHVPYRSLSRFWAFFSAAIDKKIKFASIMELNDLWLEIILDSHIQEVALVHVLQALLAKTYGLLRFSHF